VYKLASRVQGGGAKDSDPSGGHHIRPEMQLHIRPEPFVPCLATAARHCSLSSYCWWPAPVWAMQQPRQSPRPGLGPRRPPTHPGPMGGLVTGTPVVLGLATPLPPNPEPLPRPAHPLSSPAQAARDGGAPAPVRTPAPRATALPAPLLCRPVRDLAGAPPAPPAPHHARLPPAPLPHP
jgi:hypothetical protein